MLNSTNKVDDLHEFKPFLLNQKRIMGLDLGKKRIGVSISTHRLDGALPLRTISEDKLSNVIDILKSMISEYNIIGIIFGLPKNMDGTEGPSAQSVKDKIKLIYKELEIPTVLWDERLSTVGSFNLSSQLDVNVSKRVKNIDQNSATFILQGVLDYLDK